MPNASSRRWTLQVNVMAASPMMRFATRSRILRRAGMTIGNDVVVQSGCWFFSDLLWLAGGTLLGYDCHIENREPVRIGERCSISPQVTIATSTHEIGGSERRAGKYAGKPVTVGAGSWIGARAVILPGVTIGKGCLVAAGAVVVGDCEPDGLYAGIPARRRQDLPDAESQVDWNRWAGG